MYTVSVVGIYAVVHGLIEIYKITVVSGVVFLLQECELNIRWKCNFEFRIRKWSNEFSETFSYIVTHTIVSFVASFSVSGGERQKMSYSVKNIMFEFWWIIGHELSAAILKCAQVHLFCGFFFFLDFPIQENMWSVLQEPNVMHHTCVYKVHKIYLNMHNRGRVILSEIMLRCFLFKKCITFNTRHEVKIFKVLVL